MSVFCREDDGAASMVFALGPSLIAPINTKSIRIFWLDSLRTSKNTTYVVVLESITGTIWCRSSFSQVRCISSCLLLCSLPVPYWPWRMNGCMEGHILLHGCTLHMFMANFKFWCPKGEEKPLCLSLFLSLSKADWFSGQGATVLSLSENCSIRAQHILRKFYNSMLW